MQLPCAGKIEYCYRVVREVVDIYSSLLQPRKGRCVHLNCLRVLDEVEEESSTTEEGIVQDLS